MPGLTGRKCGPLAVFVVMVVGLLASERAYADRSTDEGRSSKRKAVEVFAPPSAEDLAKVKLPELRVELLAMVSADQVARSAGT